jgi:hypothetical protein
VGSSFFNSAHEEMFSIHDIPASMIFRKQKTLWNSKEFFNAAGRTRTGTAVNRMILSHVRLPIPPQRHETVR